MKIAPVLQPNFHHLMVLRSGMGVYLENSTKLFGEFFQHRRGRPMAEGIAHFLICEQSRPDILGAALRL
ncbi:hypothetical protein [Paenibacillus ginsengihumi]|uniref:hypothetical protein n=1 Tax=Paenibacillus ginsengihumi TaxID=431596 RepID=UPI00035F10FB|nr:hypothetical protein [Paenibacillus ginsengihumi]